MYTRTVQQIQNRVTAYIVEQHAAADVELVDNVVHRSNTEVRGQGGHAQQDGRRTPHHQNHNDDNECNDHGDRPERTHLARLVLLVGIRVREGDNALNDDQDEEHSQD